MRGLKILNYFLALIKGWKSQNVTNNVPFVTHFWPPGKSNHNQNWQTDTTPYYLFKNIGQILLFFISLFRGLDILRTAKINFWNLSLRGSGLTHFQITMAKSNRYLNTGINFGSPMRLSPMRLFSRKNFIFKGQIGFEKYSLFLHNPFLGQFIRFCRYLKFCIKFHLAVVTDATGGHSATVTEGKPVVVVLVQSYKSKPGGSGT